MDKEIEELLKRLEDIEDRLILDEDIGECIYNTLKILQKIYGKSIFTKFLESMNIKFNLRKLKKNELKNFNVIQRFEIGLASYGSKNIQINKRGLLANYLIENKKVQRIKINDIRKFLQYPVIFEEDPENSKIKIKEYLHYLEKEQEFLKENKESILNDIKSAWSLQNLIIHEYQHAIKEHIYEANTSGIFAFDEAYSFSLQRLIHTFDRNFLFTNDNLLKEIKNIYTLIPPRKHAYPETAYKFMKPCILMISVLVLADSISRKDNDFRNKNLFLKSNKVKTFKELNNIIYRSIDNLKNKDFKKIINNTLIKTYKNQLKKLRKEIIEELEELIDKLAKFEKYSNLEDFWNAKEMNWESLKKAITQNFVAQKHSQGMLNNIITFVSYVNILEFSGFDTDVNYYKERYITELDKVIRKILGYLQNEEKDIYESEEDVTKALIKIIGEEKTEFVKLIENLR